MSAEHLALRPAGRGDLAAVARLQVRAREHAAPAMPPLVHDPATVLRHVTGWDLGEREVWVAEDPAGALLGYLVLVEDWLEDLYVDPEAQRAGVGTALLEVARSRRPGGFCLWVFETNAPARSFYAGAGLVELERTDGSANEEGRPDLRLAWPGAHPLAFWRGLIDDVDAELGDLLARRTALTRAAQEVTAAATAGRRRDPRRERSLDAVARRVPALAREDVARIVDAVVAASVAVSRR